MVDLSKAIVKTDKFRQLQKEFNYNFTRPASYGMSTDVQKLNALDETMNKLLDILSEITMEGDLDED